MKSGIAFFTTGFFILIFSSMGIKFKREGIKGETIQLFLNESEIPKGPTANQKLILYTSIALMFAPISAVFIKIYLL